MEFAAFKYTSKVRRHATASGLFLLVAAHLSAQVCYQFSGVRGANSLSSFSKFVVQAKIADPQDLRSISGIVQGGFVSPESSLTVTIDQSVQTFDQFQVTIIKTATSTTLTISGATLIPGYLEILLSGSGNLLPNGLPPTLPSLNSWDQSTNFTSSSASTYYQGTITSIGPCGTGGGTTSVPTLATGGIVPVFGTSGTVQSGEWVSLYGTNLATATATWNGDFPTSLGGDSVTIDGKAAYLWYVSPTQINLQVPDDNATGSVPVAVTTANGTASSTVTLAQFAPSFSLLDAHHVTGIITRTGGSGAYGGGTYDILGPTGNSLGYATVAAKPGDAVTLFAVGLGPTNPDVPAGQPFSGSAPTTNPVTVLINNISVQPSYSGETSAGLYQLNLTIPANPGVGDQPAMSDSYNTTV